MSAIVSNYDDAKVRESMSKILEEFMKIGQIAKKYDATWVEGSHEEDYKLVAVPGDFGMPVRDYKSGGFKCCLDLKINIDYKNENSLLEE